MCREIVIDKLKPFKHTPDNFRDCQLEADQIPEEDLNEEVVGLLWSRRTAGLEKDSYNVWRHCPLVTTPKT